MSEYPLREEESVPVEMTTIIRTKCPSCQGWGKRIYRDYVKRESYLRSGNIIYLEDYETLDVCVICNGNGVVYSKEDLLPKEIERFKRLQCIYIPEKFLTEREKQHFR